MALKIDDIVGDGFSTSLEKLIQNGKSDKNLIAAVDYTFFVKEVLPYFLGEKEDPEFIAKWVSFLGGANVSANIVKDGEIVLTIKPIVHPVRFKTSGYKVPAFAAFDEYSKMSLVNPVVATDRLLEAVGSWYEESSLDDLYEDLKMWNKVLEDTGRDAFDLTGIEVLLGKRKLEESDAEDNTPETSGDIFGDSW